MSNLDTAYILQQQLTKARQEIHNLRKNLNTLRYVHHKEIDEIKKTLDNWQCSDCKRKQECLKAFNPPCTSIQTNRTEHIEFTPIGIINSQFPQIRGTPRQPTITMHDTTAKLTLSKDIFSNPNHALHDLHYFSHLWIIFFFHKATRHAKAKVAPPRLNGERTGVFATRSPHRPCPIGLSLVKIERIVDNVIYFTGVDMIDETPVLDIKPYIPHYDQPMSTSQWPNEEIVRIVRDVELMGLAKENEESEPDVNKTHEVEAASHMQQIEAVRVPLWIDGPRVHKLTVTFDEEALSQLRNLGPELADERSRIISNVLKEDPRSRFLRERWGCNSYIWRIDNLCVACKFNDASHTVKITRIYPYE